MPALSPVPARGRVTLVGAGPGDLELLTLKAARVLRSAEVVVYDHLVGADILALAPAGAELIFVGKKGGSFCRAQTEIDALLVAQARRGRHVVRLKGGDPFVFGRGGEEMAVLQAAGIAVDVVPGVTAAVAAGAGTGIPLTHRELASAVVFLTGHEDPGKPAPAIRWEDYGRLGATLCIYMGMKNLEGILRRLVAGGLPPETPAAVIQSAATPGQRHHVSTAARLALEAEHLGFGAPAIVIVGAVAAGAAALAPLAAAAARGQGEP